MFLPQFCSGGIWHQSITFATSRSSALHPRRAARRGKRRNRKATNVLGARRDEADQAQPIDSDLYEPFKEAAGRVEGNTQGEAKLQQIKAHVEKHREQFMKIRSRLGEAFHSKRKAQVGTSAGEAQKKYQEVSKSYANEVPLRLSMFDKMAIRPIAASYAYTLDVTRLGGNPLFSFSVAWAELCAIKARALGGTFVTNAPGFNNSMSIHKKFVKAFRDVDLD